MMNECCQFTSASSGVAGRTVDAWSWIGGVIRPPLAVGSLDGESRGEPSHLNRFITAWTSRPHRAASFRMLLTVSPRKRAVERLRLGSLEARRNMTARSDGCLGVRGQSLRVWIDAEQGDAKPYIPSRYTLSGRVVHTDGHASNIDAILDGVTQEAISDSPI
jgi:hypothetical protein